jgi:hypothetical protein
VGSAPNGPAATQVRSVTHALCAPVFEHYLITSCTLCCVRRCSATLQAVDPIYSPAQCSSSI